MGKTKFERWVAAVSSHSIRVGVAQDNIEAGEGLPAIPASRPTRDRISGSVERVTFETQPERLREVTGIGPVREARIIRGWSDQRLIREIIVWLYGHGVSSARAVGIFKTYGDGRSQRSRRILTSLPATSPASAPRPRARSH